MSIPSAAEDFIPSLDNIYLNVLKDTAEIWSLFDEDEVENQTFNS